MTHVGLTRDVLILTCAISAGIHGALAPEHFNEGPGAGLGFAAATVMLAAFAIALTVRPASALALASVAAVFAGLLISYALATTTGLPVLHPDPEPVGGLALATKTDEAVGLLAATSLLWRLAVPRPDARPNGERGTEATRPARPIPTALSALVALFSALVALAVSTGHDAHAHANEPNHASPPAAVSTREMRTETTTERTRRDVVRWRREQLTDAALPLALAAQIAKDSRYDLHALIDLAERGCQPELAARILAPLDGDSAA